MIRDKQEEARYIANFLSNLAVIGFGLALFERNLPSIWPSMFLFLLGLSILRRVKK